jgi:hypothetical protein
LLCEEYKQWGCSFAVFSWFGCIDELVFGNNSFLDYVFVFLILGVFNVILCVFSFLLSIGLMFPCAKRDMKWWPTKPGTLWSRMIDCGGPVVSFCWCRDR